MVFLKGKEVVYFILCYEIEGYDMEEIMKNLIVVFDVYC